MGQQWLTQSPRAHPKAVLKLLNGPRLWGNWVGTWTPWEIKVQWLSPVLLPR